MLIAEHMRVQKLEEELAILRERKEELVAEVAKLENDVMMSQSSIIKLNVFIFTYINIFLQLKRRLMKLSRYF